ncbi:hypothetical protein Tsp_08889 [Trichinella spiralis]|uniref:hypothetical protein n=1 Tax=Trichinella spiralis TaxID=6334 RepID=UPI0001EFEA73|nr:hypothetical protein Tsp_08889 [Trichinella spiralis]
MKKKYCAQYDCSETLLLGAKLTVKINTSSATLSKEEFFQVKRKKRSNNIILSVVAKNGIIESILRIEAIWTRSVENCNLRHRYEVLRIGDEAQYVQFVWMALLYFVFWHNCFFENGSASVTEIILLIYRFFYDQLHCIPEIIAVKQSLFDANEYASVVSVYFAKKQTIHGMWSPLGSFPCIKLLNDTKCVDI